MKTIYRLSFKKIGPVSFVSHLDIVKLFQAAIRRAALPIAFSEGFNPHQKMSFAAPLSTGYDGEHELLDIELCHIIDPVELLLRLNLHLPEGIEVFAAELTNTKKSAASFLSAADYFVEFPYIVEETVLADIMQQPEIIVFKKNKKGAKYVDIRKDIFSLSCDGNLLHMRLAAGSTNNLKPDLVVRQICELSGKIYNHYEYHFSRKQLILNGD